MRAAASSSSSSQTSLRRCAASVRTSRRSLESHRAAAAAAVGSLLPSCEARPAPAAPTVVPLAAVWSGGGGRRQHAAQHSSGDAVGWWSGVGVAPDIAVSDGDDHSAQPLIDIPKAKKKTTTVDAVLPLEPYRRVAALLAAAAAGGGGGGGGVPRKLAATSSRNSSSSRRAGIAPVLLLAMVAKPRSHFASAECMHTRFFAGPTIGPKEGASVRAEVAARLRSAARGVLGSQRRVLTAIHLSGLRLRLPETGQSAASHRRRSSTERKRKRSREWPPRVGSDK